MIPKPFPDLEKIAEPPSPPLEQAAAWWWWAGAILLGIIVLGFLAWGIVVLVRRSSLPADPLRPEGTVLRELKQLRKKAAGLSAPEFGGALSGLIRSFLHRRAGMLARFATTDEILGKSRAGHQAPPPPIVAAFGPILESCDAMKFGSGQTVSRENLLDQAEAAIQAVNETLKHGEPPAEKPSIFVDLPPSPAA